MSRAVWVVERCGKAPGDAWDPFDADPGATEELQYRVAGYWRGKTPEFNYRVVRYVPEVSS